MEDLKIEIYFNKKQAPLINIYSFNKLNLFYESYKILLDHNI